MHTFNCNCGHDIEITPPSQHAGYVVLDSDVDLHIDKRSETIRSFLDAVKSGRRAEWLRDFYGPNVPQPRFPQPRFDEKDDTDVVEDILSAADSWTRSLSLSMPNVRSHSHRDCPWISVLQILLRGTNLGSLVA